MASEVKSGSALKTQWILGGDLAAGLRGEPGPGLVPGEAGLGEHGYVAVAKPRQMCRLMRSGTTHERPHTSPTSSEGFLPGSWMPLVLDRA